MMYWAAALPAAVQAATDSVLQPLTDDALMTAVAVPPPSRAAVADEAMEDYFVWAQHHNVTGPTPRALRGVVGALDPSSLRTFLFGGCDPGRARGGCSADLDAHSIDMQRWTAVDHLAASAKPSPRSGGSATLVGDAIAFFGGDASGALTNDLYLYHPSQLEWSRARRSGAPL